MPNATHQNPISESTPLWNFFVVITTAVGSVKEVEHLVLAIVPTPTFVQQTLVTLLLELVNLHQFPASMEMLVH